MPLAPGYKIQKETLSVRFVPGNPPHLTIRADYLLANIGNAPLHFIGVELPGEKEFARANLLAKVNSQEVAPQHNPHEAADDWRVPFAASWQQKQKIYLTLSYDLAASAAADPRIFVATNMFYLNDSGWFPALMGFKALLSPSVTRPNPTDLSVTVPANFRVTASGQLRGTKKQNTETQYRFRIRKMDFDPYVLAGQYDEQRVSSGSSVFWFTKALPSLQQSAADLARTFRFYTRLFGPLPRDNATIYVVPPTSSVQSPSNANIFDLPPTVVFTSDSSGASQSAVAFPSAEDKTILAGTWFFHVVSPRPEAWLLADGLSLYAADLNQQQQTASVSRAAQISSTLGSFDRATKEAVEKPIISLSPADPTTQRRISQNKIILFLFALEDKCGQQNVTHAIHDMVYALRGEEYGYSDFRAALEQQCHQDLGGFFRTWLAQSGIPPDFRARYENADAQKQ